MELSDGFILRTFAEIRKPLFFKCKKRKKRETGFHLDKGSKTLPAFFSRQRPMWNFKRVRALAAVGGKASVCAGLGAQSAECVTKLWLKQTTRKKVTRAPNTHSCRFPKPSVIGFAYICCCISILSFAIHELMRTHTNKGRQRNVKSSVSDSGW